WSFCSSYINLIFMLTMSNVKPFYLSELAGIRSFLPEEELETRIIGGKVAWSHSWPWQACLQLTTIAACGGAIISPMWVVSAAHCFKRYKKASSWTVLAGKHDLDNPHENGQQVRNITVGVSMIITHKAYNILTKENDLALLKLQQQLMFNEYVRPIDLWMAPLPMYSKCTITGWGSTRENGPRVPRLQEVNVTIMPSDVCNKYYAGRIRPSMFCAGKEGGGVDACQGDSGGPLSCYTGSRYELAGVISWGVGCGRARKPGVYAVILFYPPQMCVFTLLTDGVCGKPQRSRCVRNPSPAAVSVPQDGPVSVVNVTESCPFTWCWMVSLQFSGYHFCSGALIHPSYVITSQHCNVRAEEDVAVLGIHDIRFSSSRIIPIDKVFNLAQDHSFPPIADLSLLRLSRPARLGTEFFQFICIITQYQCINPPRLKRLNSLQAGMFVQFVSRMRMRMKNWMTAGPALSLAGEPLKPLTACNKMWEYALTSDSHICTHPAGSTSCMGESGAPLFCRKHGDFFLFGLFTWGNRHCNADKPAVFSRVPRFDKWINEVLKDN
uniref:Zgc:55888 n=1 Tax=Sphaeramia orbicularis TaxID=375764 RepID=A0A673BHC0_9TELE